MNKLDKEYVKNNKVAIHITTGEEARKCDEIMNDNWFIYMYNDKARNVSIRYNDDKNISGKYGHADNGWYERNYGYEIIEAKDFIEYNTKFVLPEKWCCFIEDKNLVPEKYKSPVYSKDYYVYSHPVNNENHNYITGAGWIKDYEKITFEQFTKYVLKQENNMETKEIIGYKLKEDCKQYEEAVVKIAKIWSYENKGNNNIKHVNHVISTTLECRELLQKAGVLDLWFEPVYKEDEYKVGDWVKLGNNASGWGCSPEQINNKVLQITEILKNTYPEEGGVFRFGPKRTVGKSIKRLATPEEIKTAQQKEYKLSNGKTVVITKDGVKAESKTLLIEEVKSLLKYNFRFAGWDCLPTEYKIGCWANIKRSELEEIVKIYESL